MKSIMAVAGASIVDFEEKNLSIFHSYDCSPVHSNVEDEHARPPCGRTHRQYVKSLDRMVHFADECPGFFEAMILGRRYPL